MKSRQLEAILVEHGAYRVTVDTITRTLRKEGIIPVAGRGPNAPDIDHDVAAWIMAVLAGSETPANASFHLARLNNLRRPGDESRHGGEFVFALQVILSNPAFASAVLEVRVGRNLNLSRIIYRDGCEERFVHPNDVSWTEAATFGNSRFLLEGVLSGELLERVACDLAGIAAPESADAAMQLGKVLA